MVKYFILALIALCSSNVKAQELTLEQEGIQYEDICSGGMSVSELLEKSEKLKSSDVDNSDFFSTNCLLLAAHKNDSKAQYLLSETYKVGYGIPANTSYAYKWARIAAFNGYEISEGDFEKMEAEMDIDDIKRVDGEVKSYVAFQEKMTKTSGSDVKNMLINSGNFDNVTQDQLAAIEAVYSKIESLFNNDNVESLGNAAKDFVSSSSTTRLQQNPQTASTRNVDSRTNRQEQDRMMEEERMREREAIEREREEIERRREQEMERMSERETEEREVRASRGIDFYNDPYNPEFNPPPR